MKRPKVRIGTLMLLIVIAALCVALVVERRKSASMQAEMQAERDKARQMAEVALYESRLRLAETRSLLKAAEAMEAESKPR